MYYVVDNNINIERRQNGKLSQFWDDCGPHSCWVLHLIGQFLFAMKPESWEKKCIKMDSAVTKDRETKQTVFLPLEPQPRSNIIIALRRYYAKHKYFPVYEK